MAYKTLEVWFKNGKRDSVDPIEREDVFERSGLLIAARNSDQIYGFKLSEIERYEWFEEYPIESEDHER